MRDVLHDSLVNIRVN